ncbi:MAG TPA: indolepyruvate ferredoxin oxidoreductase subunit alpha [Thermoleophilia bacterium]|nr:indolepyruvate ferredoxin oxidoreductase subunit alpha [Thermoleophilia bacterium]
MRELLSGNEAIARGAWEAGVRLAAAYPGTPSTEILQNMAEYKEIESQWSPNEKVATEVALGASIAGARSLAVMKHVGVNVAADPLFTASYTGVGGGFVLVTADDPAMHSSQNEQDNRNYARFAKIPMFEPSDSQEAKDLVRVAFEISEEFDTPVLFRTTTRISHSKSIVELGERVELPALTTLEKDVPKYTMLPGFAKLKHPKVEQRITDLKKRAETLPVNRIEMGDSAVGIIATGTVYQYAREAFPQASFLKLGMTYPLPRKMIEEFRSKVERLYVVEELDPFLEEQIYLMDVKLDGGKDLFSLCGELDPGAVARGLTAGGATGAEPTLLLPPPAEAAGLPQRPPTFCPGCSHRGVFTVLKKLRVFVSGDIGCYTLGALPPIGAMHTCVCMGASIGMAHGMSKVVDAQGDIKNRAVAVIGDSTFFHSGVTGLMDTIWNRGASVTIILDNRTTAMTGGQQNPGSGNTLDGEPASMVDLTKLVEALGVKRVARIDPYDLAQTERVIREELEAGEPSVIIATAPCVLEFKIKNDPWTIDENLCNGCKRCLRVGCIALNLVEEGEKTLVEIDPIQCNGCGVCAQMCNFDAILAPEPVKA